jgi:hypothetical protein
VYCAALNCMMAQSVIFNNYYFREVKKYQGYLFYFLYWILFFIIAKGIFLLYHSYLTSTLSAGEIVNIFFYGLRMDASFAAYICILPFLLFFLKSIFPRFQVNFIIRIYTIVLLIVLSFLIAADLELYNAWGFRMDATPLQYFKSPVEMMTTISSAPVFLLLVIFILLAATFIFIYRKYFDELIDKKQRQRHYLDLIFSLFLIAFLFVPIRGGIQKIPMNISDVYFSQKIFADHAAINLPWNIMFSIFNRNNAANPFNYFSKKNRKN